MKRDFKPFMRDGIFEKKKKKAPAKGSPLAGVPLKKINLV